MFFFKKKKIVLNCFTNRQDVFEYAKIAHAKKFYPDWWKKIPKLINVPNTLSGKKNMEHLIPRPTMKNCSGMTKCYQHGVIIPLWSDLSIFVSDKSKNYYEYLFADLASEIQVHTAEQRGEFAAEEKYSHFKIVSPWFLTCDEEIDWVWMEPTWSDVEPDRITLLPGIMEFKYQHSTNINFLVQRENQNKQIILKHGRPMAQLIPLSDREIDLRLHKLTEQEFNDLSKKQKSVAFHGKYEKIKKIKKSQTCPFGFGK